MRIGSKKTLTNWNLCSGRGNEGDEGTEGRQRGVGREIRVGLGGEKIDQHEREVATGMANGVEGSGRKGRSMRLGMTTKGGSLERVVGCRGVVIGTMWMERSVRRGTDRLDRTCIYNIIIFVKTTLFKVSPVFINIRVLNEQKLTKRKAGVASTIFPRRLYHLLLVRLS